MSQKLSAPRNLRRAVLFSAGVAASTIASVALAQSQVSPADWPTYSRDLAGTRFSPLTQIDTRNVTGLDQVWSVPVARSATDNDDAPGPDGNAQATPIVVGGIMYLPVRGHEVLALDAATGAEIWRAALPGPEGTLARGVAYWPGDDELGSTSRSSIGHTGSPVTRSNT